MIENLVTKDFYIYEDNTTMKKFGLVIFDDLGYMPLQDKKSIERLLIKLWMIVE